jgi:hypothetical protein
MLAGAKTTPSHKRSEGRTEGETAEILSTKRIKHITAHLDIRVVDFFEPD